MTHLGVYLSNISMSNGEISRRTGIWKSRLSDLRNKDSSNLKAEELYLISKVLDVDPKEILEEIYGHLELK
ncbi:helix-turn-helix domain-containing protein [Maribacter sp. IgM3_T14_3]|uniref:helix-turn-helix domain-containing protein n=1 Tax=Maribacter sp. IgM3_T14_3 TaxID=3415140 RepID=UPI003C6EFFCE